MAPAHVHVVEEALALPPKERATLARLLMDSVSTDGPTDEEIRIELRDRFARLKDGRDPGVSFESIFGENE